MKKIAVYCEMDLSTNQLSDTSYELISKAYELKKEAKNIEVKDNDFDIVAIVTGARLQEESLIKMYKAGADWVVLLKNSLFDMFYPTVFSKAFIEYFNTNPCDMIIFPATPEGRMVAPRITTMLNTGLVADCTNIELIEKKGEIKLASTRPTFGAELMATIISKQTPECATIRPKTFKASFDVEINSDKIFEKYYEYQIKYPPVETRIKFIRSIVDDEHDVINFDNTNIILVAGFGLAHGKSEEYFSKLKKFAKKINAKVGATRKIIDLGLMDKSYQIGQTGSTVQANVYVSFGVSGAIQHVMGMKNSKKIIAINNDENADIFKYSDYKIVDDAKKVLDELIEKIK